MAPGRCPLAHSLSSRVSTTRNFSPASMRRLTSATFVSLIFFFASFTNFRNCGAWAIEKLLQEVIAGEHSTEEKPSRSAPCQAESSNGVQNGSGRNWQRLTRRRFRLRLIPCTLLGKGAHQVHEIPAFLLRRSVAFARHLSLAIADYPEEFAVGHFLKSSSVAPIAEFKLHVRDEVALAVAALAMTHRAVITKKFARLRQSFRRWRNRILPGRVFRRHFRFSGSRFFLRGVHSGVQDGATREQNRTQDEDCPAHIFLLQGEPAE